MRNILYGFMLGVFLFAVPAGILCAQPDTLWSSRVTTDSPVYLYGAAATADGFLVVGYISLGGSFGKNMFIAKLTTEGDTVWTLSMGTSHDEEAWGISRTAGGSFLVVGFGVSSGNRNDLVLARVSANGDSLGWRTYSSAGQTKGRDLVRLSDNNFAVVGYRLASDGTSSDMWLLKCNANGDTLWTRTYGGTGTDTGYRLQVRPNGGFAMVGATASLGAGGDDPWLVLTDSLGNNPANLTFGMAGSEYANAVTVSPSGEIFVGGRGSTGSGPALVAKCSATGSILWNHYFDQEPTAEVKGVLPRMGVGGVMCAGVDVGAGTLPWLMGVDAEGNREWSWIMNVINGEFTGIIAVPSGGALAFGRVGTDGYVVRLNSPAGITGFVRETGSGNPVEGAYVSTVGNGYVAITDANGHFTLERTPGDYTLMAFGPCVERDTLQTVSVFEDSLTQVELEIGIPHYVHEQSSINITAHNHQTGSESLVLHNTGTGEMSFQLTAQTYSPPTAWLSVDPPTGIVPAGDTLSVQVIVAPDTTDDGVFDFFGYLYLRTNSCPESTDTFPVLATVLDANDSRILHPLTYTLSAHPNPFNPQTIIAFDLPRAGEVSLVVYDITGRRVRELLHERREAGAHHIIFDAADLPSGVYIVHMESADFVASQKLLLLK